MVLRAGEERVLLRTRKQAIIIRTTNKAHHAGSSLHFEVLDASPRG